MQSGTMHNKTLYEQYSVKHYYKLIHYLNTRKGINTLMSITWSKFSFILRILVAGERCNVAGEYY